MLKLKEIRAGLIEGNLFYHIKESRFGDYIEIVKKGSSDPVAYITLNKGDDENNYKVRRDLIDIESERRYRREWDEHFPLIENFVGQLKNAGFTVNYKPERSTAGVVVYANELKISINFACFDKSLFSRNAIIYVNGDVLWTSVSADADRILALLSGDYLSNLLNDQERSSAELSHWFKTLDLSDD
jgi:hypothetical protein